MEQLKMRIYDTSLRDGTQAEEVKFTTRDRLNFMQVLDRFGVDYIELGWPSNSPSVIDCFQKARSYSLEHSKLAAFGSTRLKGISAEEDNNLRLLLETEAPVTTIFGKTWLDHVFKQLKMTPDENLEAIAQSVGHLKSHGREVIYDAEHFFDGFKDNEDYALKCIKTAVDAGADAIILCDTNGGCLSDEIFDKVSRVREFFDKEGIKSELGIHLHDDSGESVASTSRVAHMVQQVQGTINGYGERVGNADLCAILPNLMLKKNYKTNVKLDQLTQVSRTFDTLANLKPRATRHYTGESAFAQKGGIHVDAVLKGVSYTHIDPALVGNRLRIVSSDQSGSANIVDIVNRFGYEISKKDTRAKQMLDELKHMEEKMYDIDGLPAEKYLLTRKHIGNYRQFFRVIGHKILSTNMWGEDYNECVVFAEVGGEQKQNVVGLRGGDVGPVDVSYQALRNSIASEYPIIDKVHLMDYKVRIAEDLGEKSTVRVYTQYANHNEEWATVGVNANIFKASLEAIAKGFDYYLQKQLNPDKHTMRAGVDYGSVAKPVLLPAVLVDMA